MSSKKYFHDPHIDPHLQWAGKKEHTEFEVDTVSLHVHERIDPLTLIEKALKKDYTSQEKLVHYFEQPDTNPPLSKAIDFYKFPQNWSNRLICGDSMLVMNSLLHKEGLEGKVQMFYIDPPYGISYGSNFQPFINKKIIKDVDENLPNEPETIKAFRDTWELKTHSYLTYLRDRLFFAKELLSKTGSCFVQIGDENLHHVKEILDEVFGNKNFIALIAFKKKKMPLGETFIFTMCDYLLWYGKEKKSTKFNKLFVNREYGQDSDFSYIELEDGKTYSCAEYIKQFGSIPKNVKYFQSMDLRSSGRTESCVFQYEFDGRKFSPSGGKSWKTNLEGMKTLNIQKRLFAPGNTLRYKFFYEDYPVQELSHMWMDMQGATNKVYAVQTATKPIERCMLMTTNPGDLVFDPTCGSGTTAFVAEKWGRRWITCDTSRVSIVVARHRLMTEFFDYYEIRHTDEGITSGFNYKKVPHVTIRAIANHEPPPEESLYDQPIIDKTKMRVSGPFTVEAVSAKEVRTMHEIDDTSTTQIHQSSNEITKQYEEWRDELQRTGIIGKNGQKIEFNSVTLRSDTISIHAEGETKDKVPKRVLIAFGDRYSPLKKKQVHQALFEAQNIIPSPNMLLFAAFQFDPVAENDIRDIKWPGVTLLKAHMNADLNVKDLKKKSYTNQSFWLLGQPEIDIKKQSDKKYVVKILGFDFFDINTENIVSGNTSKIVMWMLDSDYDGRSIYPSQVFFPNPDLIGGWKKLSHTLKASIDEDLMNKYQSTESLPFSKGEYDQIAVKIIDDRGIESLVIKQIE